MVGKETLESKPKEVYSLRSPGCLYQMSAPPTPDLRSALCLICSSLVANV